MTTVAFDGKTLCADTKCVGAFIEQKPFQKMYKIDVNGQPCVMAIAGRFGNLELIQNWMKFGAKDKLNEADKTMGVLVKSVEGVAFEYDSSVGEGFEVGTPYAIGSGACFAMGAMLAGASAFRAVEIAARLDPDTGGEIQTYTLATDRFTGPFKDII